MILVKASLKSKPLSKLNDSKFQDTIWCQIELNQSKLIVEVCYRCTASSAENNEKLLKLLKQATVVPLGTQLLIMGDFNYPDIDYMNVDDGLGSGVGLEASELLQTVSEVGLHQHVREYTRYRSGQNPSCLDYLQMMNM